MAKHSKVTPIRRQYLQAKNQHPEAILFFRLGDFYETFDEDAETVAHELDVVLTGRSMGKGQRVPMAGVPHHSVEGYIAKLIEKGYKVAICEQVGSEPVDGLMPRDVVRVVTPGTVMEPTLLAEKRNNYLVAIVTEPQRAGVAYADITTGEFATTQIARQEDDAVLRELHRLMPAELILSDQGERCYEQGQAQSDEAARRYPLVSSLEMPKSLYEEWHFDLETCRQALHDHFGVTTLAGYGCQDQPLAIRAAGVLLQYLRENQPAALAQVRELVTYATDSFMTLDVATRRSLELTRTMRDGKLEGSLLWVLDETLTPMSGRLLRRWLNQPLLNVTEIEERLTGVDLFFHDMTRRVKLRNALQGYGDLERLGNRIIQGIANPRDLVALRDALTKVASLRELAQEALEQSTVPGADTIYPLADESLASCPDVIDMIGAAIVEEPPATLSNGGVIRRGYSEELDSILGAAREAERWVEQLQKTERERTGIGSLKVDSNKVFGYYIEITKANLDDVPEEYVRKQTLVNSERYIVPELKEKEAIILNAEERSQELERKLFDELVADLGKYAEQVLSIARAIAHLDAYLALADVAAAYDYVRPKLDESAELQIEGGRHPVVERTLSEQPFVPNDTAMSPEEAIHIITGPNMSGKSTYLRQTALVVLMAQIGSFVPARSARIGLVDRIFARVGAQDEIAAGHSTFMVEMVELANILHHATERSLLILDEIGRGTSTYDGVSLAWAAVEYLHDHPDLRPKTLFATHYHELTELETFLQHVRNYNVAVRSDGDQVIFTHNIVPGGADRSYGIHVAEMAGLPRGLIDRAQEILSDLEGAAENVPVKSGRTVLKVRQLPLFAAESPALDELRSLDVEQMSPLEALNKLHDLQKKAK